MAEKDSIWKRLQPDTNSDKEACGVQLLRVSATSRTPAVAGLVRDGGRPILQAIEAGAVNQAVKAVTIARGYLAGDGMAIVVVPEFGEVLIDRLVRTTVRSLILRPMDPIPPVPAVEPAPGPASERGDSRLDPCSMRPGH